MSMKLETALPYCILSPPFNSCLHFNSKEMAFYVRLKQQGMLRMEVMLVLGMKIVARAAFCTLHVAPAATRLGTTVC